MSNGAYFHDDKDAVTAYHERKKRAKSTHGKRTITVRFRNMDDFEEFKTLIGAKITHEIDADGKIKVNGGKPFNFVGRNALDFLF